MNILLINPPSPYLENDAAYPPMGLMYLAGKIEALGHTAVIEDMSGGRPLSASRVNDADAVGITCVTPNVKVVKALAKSMPEKHVLIGGPHPTFRPETFMDVKNAIPVVGEADALIQTILEDLIISDMQPIYREIPFVTSRIAAPARHLVDLSRYTPGGWAGSTVLYTSRGCPYTCRFCSKVSGCTYREFSKASVLTELEECMALGFERLVFGDDNIMVNPRRLEILLSALKPYGIEYRLNMDARTLTPSLAALAHASGCVSISFGVESGSQIMLDRMNKSTTVARNTETLKIARGAGIRTKAYLMVNFPGETENTITETIEFIDQTRPDDILVSNFTPLPGSFVFKYPSDYGINWLNHDWSEYYLAGKEAAPSVTFTTDELTAKRQYDNKLRLMDEIGGLV